LRISVAMIVLDDALNIFRALTSCDFADEIVIVDGGSTDATIREISRFTTENPDRVVKVYTHPWPDNFSIQRNLSFEKCDGDFIIRLDSDEMFGLRLRGSIKAFLTEIPNEALSIRIRQNNIIDEDLRYAANLGGWESHPRIFRRSADLNWVGKVHEYVELVDRMCIDWNVCVNHYGWVDREKLKKKEQKYMEMPGSGFETVGSLTDRFYEVRQLPYGVL